MLINAHAYLRARSTKRMLIKAHAYYVTLFKVHAYCQMKYFLSFFSDFGYPSDVVCWFRIFDDISPTIWLLGRLLYHAFDCILCGICHSGQGIHVSFFESLLKN